MEYTVMSNVHENEDKRAIKLDKISQKDRQRLRMLAKRWKEIAASDEMKERKRLWKCLRDLKPERPMILFETFSVAGYVTDKDLECANEFLRNVEKTFVYGIRQYEELGDDIVLEEYYRIPWMIERSDYGVKIIEHHAENSMGYKSNFPIATPDDLNKLKKRSFMVDRQATQIQKSLLEELFGDIMPVKVGNFDNFFSDPGFTPFTGNNFVGITMDAFKLIGNDNMMMWPYDNPDALHRLMRYLTDDRLQFYHWMKDEGLLDFNTDNQFAGPSGYGYVSDLPMVGTQKEVEFKDLWVWPESQETVCVSPQMFNEFFLPYIAEVTNMFGLSYYGCCERIDDRFEYIKKALPNLRTVSISGWSDLYRAAEMLGKDYVYCRKPVPAHISGSSPDWEFAKKDLKDTYESTKAYGCVELIVRDVYDLGRDINRIAQWVELAKSIMKI
ncbi:MAG: hypothetical protein ACOYEJ_05125 [Mahellales bacterium]|jgi:hypothetical protein